MERDSLLAHGCGKFVAMKHSPPLKEKIPDFHLAFLLQDRLLNCSDYTRSWICRQCGSFLSPQATVVAGSRKGGKPSGIVKCRRCAEPADHEVSKTEVWEDGSGRKFVGGNDVAVVAVPGVLKYLDVELSAMGIKMRFNVEP